MTGQKDTDLSDIAIKHTNNYLKAFSIAEKVYGVTVSQDEVTKYIDENITPIVSDNKEAYANALGLTTYELDYAFDRDIYALDTLWNKLIPVLMKEHPQQDGEDDNDYMDRIKAEFYSHE